MRNKFSLRYFAGMLALVSQLLFLILVVPTHTRGATRVDGLPSQAQEDSCCRHDRSSNSSKKSPTDGDRAACSICFVTARLDTAVPTTIKAPAPQLIAVLEVAQGEPGISLPISAVYDGRAPPL